MTGSLPTDAPARLCELSDDARAAILLDDRGQPVATSDAEGAEELAEASRELLRAVARAAGGAPSELEAQVLGGSVYAVSRPGFTLLAVARRATLSSLMLYDMRAVLGEVPGALRQEGSGAPTRDASRGAR